ncbi:DUF1707 SHOCT-like domain-containing protein [Nocardia aurea]|uniref:DUF1707 SHOCT-like domain-containing protein n=1 Tax=Nocardia aurea TaxID=2144174 RepID=UPI003F4B4970
MSTTASGRMRARDLDRSTVSSVLDAAYAEGQLGAGEYHDRTARAASAKTLGELDALVADLQSPTAVTDLTSRRAGAPRDTRTTSWRNALIGRRTSGGYPGHTRAREIDRAATVRALDDARAEGQLTADEHAALTELAAEARTLGDLAELVDDLQRRADAPLPPSPPRSYRSTVLNATLGVLAVLAAIAGFAVTGREDPPPVAQASVPVDLSAVEPLVIATPKLTTAAGMTLFRERYRAKFGDTIVDEVWFHEDYASVKRVAPDGAQWTVGYDYRGGFQPAPGPVLSTRERNRVPVDLATVDFEAIDKVAAAAPVTTKVPQGVVSAVSIDVPNSGSFGGRPVAEINVRNERSQYGDVQVSITGEVLKVREVR